MKFIKNIYSYFFKECISNYEPPKADLVALANKYLTEEGQGVWDGHNDLPMTYTYHETMDQNLDKIDLYDPTLNFTETTIPWAKEGQLRRESRILIYKSIEQHRSHFY